MRTLPFFALVLLLIVGTVGCVEQPAAFPEGQAPTAANTTAATAGNDGAGTVAGSKNDKYGWTLPAGATAYPLTEENYDKVMKADLEGDNETATILAVLGTPSLTKNLERGKKEYTWYYTNADGMVVKYYELTTLSGEGSITVSGEDERHIDPEWAKKYYDEDEEDETGEE